MSLSAQRVAMRTTHKAAARSMRATRLVVRATGEEPAPAPTEEKVELNTTRAAEPMSATTSSSPMQGYEPAVLSKDTSLADVMAFSGDAMLIVPCMS